MAPEQARGEQLDARADVFALGATLAAILTGKPAFVGATPIETVRKAGAADLTDVFARLDSCGADADLIALAKRCLSADRESRPSDGRAVAIEVAAYRAGVEARLKRAETDKAKAEIQAAEQRKRRRHFNVAAGVVVGVLLAGVAVSTWFMLGARQAEHDATAALEAYLESQIQSQWTDVNRGQIDIGGGNLNEQLAEQLIQDLAKLNPTHTALARGRSNYGAILAHKARYSDAEPYLVRGYEDELTEFRRLGSKKEHFFTVNWLHWEAARIVWMHAAAGNGQAAAAARERFRSELPPLPSSPLDKTDPPRWMGNWRALLTATAHLRCGSAAEGVRTLTTVHPSGQEPPEFLYSQACVYSASAGSRADGQKAHPGLAVDLLERAVRSGFADLDLVRRDPALDPIRERDDFKKLVAELEKR